MKPKVEGLTRLATDATDEIAGSDDEFDEPVITALGKRDRLGGPSKRTDAKRDSSGEEAERPNKNRVSGGVFFLGTQTDRISRRRRLPRRTTLPPRQVPFVLDLFEFVIHFAGIRCDRCHSTTKKPELISRSRPP